MKNIIDKVNNKFYYGWIIVLLSAVTLFLSAPGQTYSISVFIKVYKEEFGYTSTQISTAYSIATLISGTMLVFMGKSIDKFGVKRMLIVVPIMLAVATFFNSFVSSLYMMFFGFFLLRYFGQGSMTLIPNTLVPQWFERKRAFAISIAGIGGLLSMLLVPSINLFLINNLGWQNAWRIWGIILLIGFVPLAVLFAVNRPEDVGMVMENDAILSDSEVKEAFVKMEKLSFTLKQAIRTKEFWIVGMISMIPAMFSTGLTFHFFTIMELRNIGETSAAMIIGFLAVPAFVMPFVSKLVVDRYPVRNILSVTLFMTILSMVFLIIGISSQLTAIIFILFYGLAVAVQSLSTNVVWPNYFGRLHLGSIRGASTVFMVIGSALGPLPFGFSYDKTGSYTIAVIGMIIFTAISLVLSFLIKKPHKKI